MAFVAAYRIHIHIYTHTYIHIQVLTYVVDSAKPKAAKDKGGEDGDDDEDSGTDDEEAIWDDTMKVGRDHKSYLIQMP